MDKLVVTPILSSKLITEVGEISDKVWSDHYEALLGPGNRDVYHLKKVFLSGFVKPEIKNGGLYYFVENAKRERLGYFGIYKIEDDKSTPAIINAIYVFPQHRRRGYGRRILQLIEKILIMRKIKVVILQVPDIDIKATNFFKVNKYSSGGCRFERSDWGKQIKYQFFGKELA